MLRFIILSIAFIGLWIITVQLLRGSFDHDDEVIDMNTHMYQVKVVKYIVYRKYGVLTALYGDTEYTFIDKHLKFRQILQNNIGEDLFITFMSRVEGIFLFYTTFYLLNVTKYEIKKRKRWR